MTVYRKKLIEVALPLDAINQASAREKSIRHGHPSTLHLWWARKPLAAARAVTFAQMVDDPSAWPELFPTVADQDMERVRLFKLIEDIVQWENTTNEEVMRRARWEIRKSWRRTCEDQADGSGTNRAFDPGKLPAFHDPFAGGGTLPLEAQRLGLETHASDLNPVAVLINKAMIEIPPMFVDRPAVNPEWRGKPEQEKALLTTWNGALGLAEDVRYYGKWMREEATKRIGRLYPKAHVSSEACRGRPDLKRYEGRELTVIAWLWTRTVRSPNPAFGDVQVPLASSFWLSTKKEKEAWVEPMVDGREWRFEVRKGMPEDPRAVGNGTKLSRGANFRCLVSGTPIGPEWIKAEGKAGRMGAQLTAVVAEGDRERVYLNPTLKHKSAAATNSEWGPDQEIPNDRRWFSPPIYGMTTYADLFTPRQLVALTTFSDLVVAVRKQVRHDAVVAGMPDDGRALREGGRQATGYGEAVAAYLGLAVSRLANFSSSLSSWNAASQGVRQTFGRQALPMMWDFCESSPFSNSSGNWLGLLQDPVKLLEKLPATHQGTVHLEDAQQQETSAGKVVSTDPPYYDNMGWADLSDFFYVWLRRSLANQFPDLFLSITVPKAEELVATPYRHGNKSKAERFFLDGTARAMRRLALESHRAYPVTIYYAFKQSEQTDGKKVSTGWETFLEAIIKAGFSITGTWPIRTQRKSRPVGLGTNALASSIVLVCRKRATETAAITRRQFQDALAKELPEALRKLQTASIAPVDLAQAAIGPGMAIFTRHCAVIYPDGSAVKVREALRLINQALGEALEGDFDDETRWAVAWFGSHGFDAGDFGVAEVLAKAKNISLVGLAEAGVLESSGGQVRLLRHLELSKEWDSGERERPTTWEKTHHLLRVYEEKGEIGAAELLDDIGPTDDTMRDLAYSAYLICERNRWADAAFGYNALVQSWPEIVRQSRLKPWLPQFEIGGDSDAD